jgi:hypothetical protein
MGFGGLGFGHSTGDAGQGLAHPRIMISTDKDRSTQIKNGFSTDFSSVFIGLHLWPFSSSLTRGGLGVSFSIFRGCALSYRRPPSGGTASAKPADFGHVRAVGTDPLPTFATGGPGFIGGELVCGSPFMSGPASFASNLTLLFGGH